MCLGKEHGITKIAINDAANIPAITVVPKICLEIAPAPEAIASGTHPNIKAKDVIRIGLKRNDAAVKAASKIDLPDSFSALAYSTIKMAFLAANPIKTTIPI